MVVEQDWQKHFEEAYPEWKDASQVEALPLFEPGTAPRRSFIPWDEPEYLPKRDTIKVYAATDMASTRPVQVELEYWFSYEAGAIIKNYCRTADIRFRLLMIYGKGDTPDPEQIVALTGRGNKQLTKMERYFRGSLRHAMREAILVKLDAKPHEVKGLDSVIKFHTTVNCEADRG